MAKLYKVNEGKMLFGVCTGLGATGGASISYYMENSFRSKFSYPFLPNSYLFRNGCCSSCSKEKKMTSLKLKR